MFRKHDLPHNQHCSHNDCAVGDVERWPLVGAEIKEEKIDDMSGDDAVPQVSNRTAENKCQAYARRREQMPITPEQDGDDTHRNC